MNLTVANSELIMIITSIFSVKIYVFNYLILIAYIYLHSNISIIIIVIGRL